MTCVIKLSLRTTIRL